MVDKRTIKGKKRKDNRRCTDKTGKAFHLGKHELVEIEIYVPDFNRFKTVQLSMTCWIKIPPDTLNDELQHSLSLLKKRIKIFLRDWKQPFFRPESIVAFKTGNSVRRSSEKQYLLSELVFYVKPDMIFDRKTIQKLVEPVAHHIIENIIPTQDTFEICRNLKMEARPRNKRN